MELQSGNILHLESVFTQQDGLIICLRESNLGWDSNPACYILDSAVCLNLGHSNLIDYSVHSNSRGDSDNSQVICFLLENGQVITINCVIQNETSSILQSFVFDGEGMEYIVDTSFFAT